MTKTLTFTLATFLSLPALAMGQAAKIDANADGVLTLDEVQAVYPEITSDMFLTMDADGDGLLSEDEVTAAQDAGLMPTPET